MIFLVIPCLERAREPPRALRRACGTAPAPSEPGSSSSTTARVTGRASWRASSPRVPLTLVTHEVNRGLGAAIASGLEFVLREGNDDDVVVTVESDNTADLGDVPRSIERLEARRRRGHGVIPGARRQRRGGLAMAGGGVSRLAGLFRLAGGLRDFHQVTPLYRAYRLSALRRAVDLDGEDLVTETGFAVNVELLLKLRRAGARVVQIPTTLDWTRRRGHSTMPVLSTARAYVRLLLRCADCHADEPRHPPGVSPEQ